MIMKDQVTANERLSFVFMPALPIDFFNQNCCCCANTPEDIVNEKGCTYLDVERDAVLAGDGDWYCCYDCFRSNK